MSKIKNRKKKGSFGKVLLWILVAVIALQVLSEGEFLEDLFESFQPSEQSDPASPGQTVGKASFGVAGQDADNNAGALVTVVTSGGPAEQAGIQVGDIITALNGYAVCNGADFMHALDRCEPGQTVEVSLIRDGTEKTVSVTLAEAVEDPTQPPAGDQDQSGEQNKHPYLPAELREHVLIDGRDSGISATLTGDVLITVIFVNDPTSTWTAEKISATKAGDTAMTAEILSEAAAFGTKLNITIDYRQGTATTTEEVDARAWAEQIVASAGLGQLSTASAELERTKGVKEAPILFYVNATERSYALPDTNGDTEYAIIWNCGSDTVTYRHELYHLFGAADFYMPKAITECANRHWPNSTMLTADNAVTDELTAYLIGWTEAPTQGALTFLRETAHVTEEDVSQEYERNTHTGYVENWETDGGYVTGYLDFGILEGQGKVVHSDGSRYDGDFKQNALDGQGTFVWADGSRYTGQWSNNQCHGYGTYTWPDGNSVSGTWENGTYIG